MIERPPGNRDRREKPQEEQPAFARWMMAEEGVDQRVGKAENLAKSDEMARATFQKGVLGKCSRQKVCQRVMVVRSAPKRSESSRTRRGEGPCRMAVIKTTMKPA